MDDPADATRPRKKRGRTWLFRLGLVFVGSVVALSIGEIALRFALPADSFIRGHEWGFWRQNSDLLKDAFVADAELGFHPRLGTAHYDPYGALILGGAAHPIAKSSGKRRVVFLGDSVTTRRSIEHALRDHFGATGYEYWNCGVEGYNTYQEVRYYERFCRRIQPDHVIVTLHNNDYMSTPVAFYDDEDRMAVFSPDRSSIGLNPTLYRYSYIYRVWFSWRVAGRAMHDESAGAESIRASLTELRDLLAVEGAKLTVFVLPMCKPDAEWVELERTRHTTSLRILNELGIPHFDLRPGLRDGLANGVDVQETKGDGLHPSAAAGGYFVKHLVGSGFSL